MKENQVEISSDFLRATIRQEQLADTGSGGRSKQTA